MIQAREVKKSLTAAKQSSALDVKGLASLAIDLTGTFTATVIFEYTINDVDWYTLTANVVGSSTTATGATAAGKWIANVAGFSQVRVRITAFTSGTLVVAQRAILSGGGSGSSSGSGGSGDVQTVGADVESNTANSQRVSSRIEGFNGTTWDRIKAGITAATATLTGFLNTLPWGIYHITPSVRTDGQGGPLETDATGNLKTTLATLLSGEDTTNVLMAVLSKPIPSSTYSPLVYAPLTQVTKANIKNIPGNVLSTYITNDNAAVRYFQLHNKATAPAAADVPVYSFKVPAGTANNPGVLILDNTFWTEAGKNFTLGIGWAISTTFGTFTDSATASEHIPVVHYV